MKLFSLTILFKEDDEKSINKLCSAYDMTSFGYFQQQSIREFMDFSSKILVEKTPVGQHLSVSEKEYVCHAYVRTDRLASVLISDSEYPERVALSIITKILEDFAQKFPPLHWKTAKPGSLQFKDLDKCLVQYQDPKSADTLTKLQSDVDDTKVILHRNLESLLDRGEKLDDLVNQSEELSLQAKLFYKTIPKTNRCCVIL